MKPAPAQKAFNQGNQGYRKDNYIVGTILKLRSKRAKPDYS